MTKLPTASRMISAVTALALVVALCAPFQAWGSREGEPDLASDDAVADAVMGVAADTASDAAMDAASASASGEADSADAASGELAADAAAQATLTYWGGSLRLDKYLADDGTYTTDSADIRFGFNFTLPADAELESFWWEYGTTSGLGQTLAGTSSREAGSLSADPEGATGTVANIVFAGVPVRQCAHGRLRKHRLDRLLLGRPQPLALAPG